MAVDVFRFSPMEMLVLLFLKKGDAHGYQLVQLLEEYSGGALTVKTASLYPILYKLEESGCITGKETFVERKSSSRPGRSARVRIVYHIEPPGLERLEHLRNTHKQFIDGCNTVFLRTEGRDDGDENEC